MKKNIVLFAVIVMLTGCATVVPPTSTAPKDQEPVLIGLSMKEKIATASKEINSQVDLLNKINQNSYVGTYKLVTHNNELDARKGSSRTVPQQVSNNTTNTNETIKKIDWEQSSLNELVKGFGTAAGYKVVLVSGNTDKMVTFHVENENIFNALNRLKAQVATVALITVVAQEKTIYLNYN